MFDTQEQALAHALASRPRGLKNGDAVRYGTRVFEVIAIQQWMTKGTPHAVGLVWASNCSSCGAAWHQMTETRPEAITEECPKCDLIGASRPTVDEVVVAELRTAAWNPSKYQTGNRDGVKRRGRIDLHVIEVAAVHFSGKDVIKLLDLVDKAVAELPEPEDGKRDTRRQHVMRAVQNLSKEKNGPLQISGNTVILFD